jgi:hypothetical protein
VLTSYPLLWRDIDGAGSAQPFHLLVLDEAQMVKNAGSRTATAVRRLQARHRLCLTGTPLENHLGELWAQFDFLMPGYLGDQRSFQRRWRTPIEQHGETAARPAAGRSACALHPAPPQGHMWPPSCRRAPTPSSACTLAGDSARCTKACAWPPTNGCAGRWSAEGFDGAQITILDALLKLRQVCCDPRLLDPGVPSARPVTRAARQADLAGRHPARPGGRRPPHAGVLAVHHACWPWCRGADTLGLPYLMLTGETPAQRGAVVASSRPARCRFCWSASRPAAWA